jgi:hypothetical protein
MKRHEGEKQFLRALHELHGENICVYYPEVFSNSFIKEIRSLMAFIPVAL